MELDIDLLLLQRTALGFHTFACASCRRFRKQLGIVEDATAKYYSAATIGLADAELPPESVEHLKALISERLVDES
jgi:hypothetical protein